MAAPARERSNPGRPTARRDRVGSRGRRPSRARRRPRPHRRKHLDGEFPEGGQVMRTLIEGGWVVAFNGTSHEVHEEGSVVFEDDRIVHAGGALRGLRSTRGCRRAASSCRRASSTPTCTPRATAATTCSTTWPRTTTARPTTWPSPRPSRARWRRRRRRPWRRCAPTCFSTRSSNGSTTIIDVGGLRGDWEGYVRLVDELGVRVYGEPALSRPQHVQRRAGAPLLRDRHRRGHRGARRWPSTSSAPTTAPRRGGCAAC